MYLPDATISVAFCVYLWRNTALYSSYHRCSHDNIAHLLPFAPPPFPPLPSVGEEVFGYVVGASSAVPGLAFAPCQPALPIFFLPLRDGLILSATCLLWAAHTGRDRIGLHSTFAQLQ